MKSLEQQVRDNTMRSYIWMALLTALIGTLGTCLSYIFDWGMTGTSSFIIVAAILNVAAFFFSDSLILMASRARAVDRQKIPQLYEIVERLCATANMPVPKLYIIEDRSMNAFATGRNQKHSAVAVTRALLEKMSADELEGVLAHELSHIRNNDMRFAAIVSVLVGAISLTADLFWSSQLMGAAQSKDRSGIAAMIGLAFAIFAPLTAMFVQLAISRKRESLADLSGVSITNKPTSLASALKKISRDMSVPSHASPATAHLYFSTPNRDTLIERLFSTHPPIEERIKALESLER